MKKLYCGGRFNFDYLKPNYIDYAKDDYRALILKDVNLLLQNNTSVNISETLAYIGPFYFESDTMIDKDIVNTELKMVKDCDYAIFLLDDGLCPGTVAELTIASMLNKITYIFYIKKGEDEETESSLHSPCWYPITLSELINDNTKIYPCNNLSDAKNKIIELIIKLKKGDC